MDKFFIPNKTGRHVMKKLIKIAIIFLVIFAWIFSGWPRIWENPTIPPEVLTTRAASPEAFSADGTFTPANGIYAVTVECWGGGGGGGKVNNSAGGGGGGGAYAKSTAVAVTPGTGYAVDVGAGGGSEGAGANSTFNGTTVVAAGGGATLTEAAGAGGLASASTWNAIGSNGGDGGTGYDQGPSGAGGGGGGAGGPNGAGKVGANATVTLSGAGGDGNNSVGTGTGGTIVDDGAGNPGGNDLTYGGGGGAGSEGGQIGGAGGIPGGGGGGGSDNANGGAGTDGQCIVSYTDTWAPSVNQTSYDNAWTFATAPNNDAGGQISMAATPGYDYNAISYSFAFTACASDGGTGGTSSGWQAGASYSDTGLDPNKCYGYTVQTKDSLENTGTASTASETYSSANVPGQPSLGSATATTLTLTNDANGNPTAGPITLFAVKVVTGDAGWINNWVNAAGEPVGSEDWLRDDQLDGLIIGSGGTPLTAETTYGVQVEAKNGNGDITILGLEGQGVTSAGAVATLTLTIDSGSPTNLGTVDSGTPVTGTTRLKIDTNNSSGYYIVAGRNNIINNDALFSAYGNLTIDDSGIPTHTTGCTTPRAWNAASTGLGFSVYNASGGGKNTTCWGSSSTETGANLYAAFAASASATTILNESDNTPNPSYVSIGYKLDVTSIQTATTYNDGQIVFTATTN